MANYTQTNTNVGSSYYNYFVSQLGLGDDYIIFATDDYYYCVSGDYANGRFTDSRIQRISRSYGSQGSVSEFTETNTTVNINYPYYSYSNVGVGTSIEIPARRELRTDMLTYMSILLTIFLVGAALFKVIKRRWVL